MLDEAREDETALAALETELELTEQQLATARTNSSRLRTQLAAKMTACHSENGFSADYPTVRSLASTPVHAMMLCPSLVAALVCF